MPCEDANWNCATGMVLNCARLGGGPSNQLPGKRELYASAADTERHVAVTIKRGCK